MTHFREQFGNIAMKYAFYNSVGRIMRCTETVVTPSLPLSLSFLRTEKFFSAPTTFQRRRKCVVRGTLYRIGKLLVQAQAVKSVCGCRGLLKETFYSTKFNPVHL